MESEIVDEFEYRGHFCVVVKMEIDGTFHNGYVEIPKPKRRELTSKRMSKHQWDVTYHRFSKYNLPQELTYSDMGIARAYEDKYFIGFDTNHLYNYDHRETQTQEYAKKELKKLVDALIDCKAIE